MPAGSWLFPEQQQIVDRPLQGSLFVEGPAVSGKTTAAALRLRRLIEAGVPASQILVLLPQRTLAGPYEAVLTDPAFEYSGVVDILTVNGLAQRMVELFWPVAATQAGFTDPNRPPTFLTLETAQYYLSSLVRPLITERGFFDSVTIDRNRLYGQLLENLNKAVVNGFPVNEIGERLESGWLGESSQKRIYKEVQECASLFREFCLRHNLLDFSLQLEVFWNQVWPLELCQKYLRGRYQYLIFDNLEEDTPLAHDLVCSWMPGLRSTLLVYDQGAGYRLFLGADPGHALSLRAACQDAITLDACLANSPGTYWLGIEFSRALGKDVPETLDPGRLADYQRDARVSLVAPSVSEQPHFHTQLVDWTVEQIRGLVCDQGLPPSEIVVLAPYLSDALRFALMHRLERAGIPARSHRPSQGLRTEPAARCLLTLARLAHPNWNLPPDAHTVARCLTQAIDGLDPVRAQLLTRVVYPRPREGRLQPFHVEDPVMRDRITYSVSERYQRLQGWLHGYQAGPPAELDIFFSQLFGEVLSQAGFGYHSRLDAGAAAARLVESARKFRWVTGETLADEGILVGREYLQVVEEGLISAQYLSPWTQLDEAVLVAPATTFLMSNRVVDIQFWLDVGSQGWWERLDQPLTQPYVLGRGWQRGRGWSDADEVAANTEMLYRVLQGLLRRCRGKVYLGLCDLSESGFEMQGPLLKVIQKVLRQLPITDDAYV